MSTLLVTGGAGFIGGNFVAAHVAAGSSVVNLDALTYAGHRETLADLAGDPAHTLVVGRIGDRALVDRLLAEQRPRAIVNFAAESHVDRSIDGPAAFVQTNVVETCSLLDATLAYWRTLPAAEREAFRFLQVSTDEVYGSLGPEGHFSETTPFAPNSPYSASKAAADGFVRAYHHTFGLPTLTTHCSNNYGPYQFVEKLIPRMIGCGVAGQPLEVYGDGQNVRDWLHVSDHCAALTRVLEAGTPGETYCIGGDSERANIHVVRTLCDLLDELVPQSPHRPHEQLITFVTDRPGHDRRYAIDARKIRETLGWTPSRTFEDGLRETVRWYLDNTAWCEAVAGQDAAARQGLSA